MDTMPMPMSAKRKTPDYTSPGAYDGLEIDKFSSASTRPRPAAQPDPYIQPRRDNSEWARMQERFSDRASQSPVQPNPYIRPRVDAQMQERFDRLTNQQLPLLTDRPRPAPSPEPGTSDRYGGMAHDLLYRFGPGAVREDYRSYYDNYRGRGSNAAGPYVRSMDPGFYRDADPGSRDMDPGIMIGPKEAPRPMFTPEMRERIGMPPSSYERLGVMPASSGSPYASGPYPFGMGGEQRPSPSSFTPGIGPNSPYASGPYPLGAGGRTQPTQQSAGTAPSPGQAAGGALSDALTSPMVQGATALAGQTASTLASSDIPQRAGGALVDGLQNPYLQGFASLVGQGMNSIAGGFTPRVGAAASGGSSSPLPMPGVQGRSYGGQEGSVIGNGGRFRDEPMGPVVPPRSYGGQEGSVVGNGGVFRDEQMGPQPKPRSFGQRVDDFFGVPAMEFSPVVYADPHGVNSRRGSPGYEAMMAAKPDRPDVAKGWMDHLYSNGLGGLIYGGGPNRDFYGQIVAPTVYGSASPGGSTATASAPQPASSPQPTRVAPPVDGLPPGPSPAPGPSPSSAAPSGMAPGAFPGSWSNPAMTQSGAAPAGMNPGMIDGSWSNPAMAQPQQQAAAPAQPAVSPAASERERIANVFANQVNPGLREFMQQSRVGETGQAPAEWLPPPAAARAPGAPMGPPSPNAQQAAQGQIRGMIDEGKYSFNPAMGGVITNNTTGRPVEYDMADAAKVKQANQMADQAASQSRWNEGYGVGDQMNAKRDAAVADVQAGWNDWYAKKAANDNAIAAKFGATPQQVRDERRREVEARDQYMRDRLDEQNPERPMLREAARAAAKRSAERNDEAIAQRKRWETGFGANPEEMMAIAMRRGTMVDPNAAMTAYGTGSAALGMNNTNLALGGMNAAVQNQMNEMNRATQMERNQIQMALNQGMIGQQQADRQLRQLEMNNRMGMERLQLGAQLGGQVNANNQARIAAAQQATNNYLAQNPGDMAGAERAAQSAWNSIPDTFSSFQQGMNQVNQFMGQGGLPMPGGVVPPMPGAQAPAMTTPGGAAAPGSPGAMPDWLKPSASAGRAVESAANIKGFASQENVLDSYRIIRSQNPNASPQQMQQFIRQHLANQGLAMGPDLQGKMAYMANSANPHEGSSYYWNWFGNNSLEAQNKQKEWADAYTGAFGYVPPMQGRGLNEYWSGTAAPENFGTPIPMPQGTR